MNALAWSDLFTPRDTRNLRIFNAWALATVFVFGAATLLIAMQQVDAAGGWSLTAVAAILGVITLRSYVVFLRQADELLRKIQLEGLALGFGVGAVFMLVYRLCERLGAPDLDINDPFLVMLISWLLGQWYGVRRYAGEGAGE